MGKGNKRFINICDTTCYKCGSKMRVSYIVEKLNATEDGGLVIQPDGFTRSELLLVRNKGVEIEKVYSMTVRRLYFANICPHCNAFVGENYLHNYYSCECETIESPELATLG
jgi:RNase P subunit RPR2